MPRGSLLDTLDEAAQSAIERPARTALTVVGTILGVAMLSAVMGLSASAATQIDSRFTAQSATEVSAQQVPGGSRVRNLAFPADTERRLGALDGVQSAGLTWRVPPAQRGSVSGYSSPASQNPPQVEVAAASPGLFDVVGATLLTGRFYDSGAEARSDDVAVLGAVAARELGVVGLDPPSAITIGGRRFVVIGIVGDAASQGDLLTNVLVPTTTARKLWGDPLPEEPATAYVRVRPGAATVVANELALALDAAEPDQFSVVPPPDPNQLRGGVNDDLGASFAVISAICLVVGAVGIANTTIVSVMQRAGEIGLRRALGASRFAVAGQFLAEAALTGLVGGAVGVVVGIAAVLAVTLSRHWTAVVPPETVPIGIAVGVLTGLLAGLYPAVTASRIEPAAALRQA